MYACLGVIWGCTRKKTAFFKGIKRASVNCLILFYYSRDGIKIDLLFQNTSDCATKSSCRSGISDGICVHAFVLNSTKIQPAVFDSQTNRENSVPEKCEIQLSLITASIYYSSCLSLASLVLP